MIEMNLFEKLWNIKPIIFQLAGQCFWFIYRIFIHFRLFDKKSFLVNNIFFFRFFQENDDDDDKHSSSHT